MEADGREADLLSTTLPEGLVPQESANPDLIWLYDWVEEAEREDAAEQRATRTEHALDAIQQQLVETHATIAHALREHTAEVEAKIEKVHRDHAMEMEVQLKRARARVLRSAPHRCRFESRLAVAHPARRRQRH